MLFRSDGQPVTADQIQIVAVAVDDLVPYEMCFLQGLAFTALYNDVIALMSQHWRVISEHSTFNFLPDKTLSRPSFIRISNPSAKIEDLEHHFIHLNFQEYFAARYFVHQTGHDFREYHYTNSFLARRPGLRAPEHCLQNLAWPIRST